MAIMFTNRTSGAISVQHDRSPVAVTLSDGSVRNAYTASNCSAQVCGAARVRFEGGKRAQDVTMAVIGNEAGKPVTLVLRDGSKRFA